MPKTIRYGEPPIYLAPYIKGYNRDGVNIAIDCTSSGKKEYVIDEFETKLLIYKRSVVGWFLNPASQLIEKDMRVSNEEYGGTNIFVALMVCLSYYEGIQKYIEGNDIKNGQSSNLFCRSINRIYANRYPESVLKKIYKQARCGLFHSGMVDGDILATYFTFMPIEYTEHRIYVNPRVMLADIKADFKKYISDLRNSENADLRANFDKMFSNLPR